MLHCYETMNLFYGNLQKKNLGYTRLIPFLVSRVSGAHLLDFAPGTIFQRLQRWRVFGNVREI